MNPLSDIGMPDWFWDKFRALCTHDEHPTGKCDCGSGLPLANCRIPLWTRRGIIYTEHWYGFFDRCLACQTRLLWSVASKAGMRNPPTLIEPSNAERATWPDCTRSYVERLESFYDDAPPYGLEDSASAPDGPQLEAQALAHLVDVLGDDGETESEVASVDPPAPVDPLDALREDVAKLAKIVQLLANSIVIDDGILATTRDIFERNQRVS